MKRMGLVAVLVMCALLVWLSGPAAAAQTFKWSQKTLEKKGKGWVFKYAYPVLAAPGGLMGVQGIVKDFNSKMKGQAEAELATFTKAMKNFKAPAGAPKMASQHTVTCKQVGTTAQYASFMFEHTEMTPGMAHPNTWYTTLNWSAGGNFLVLADLFNDLPKALGILSVESGKALKAKMGKDAKILDPAGWAAKADNFKNFCLTPQGLCIYFTPMQAGPWSMGGQSITIPWKKLDKVLSPKLQALLK